MASRMVSYIELQMIKYTSIYIKKELNNSRQIASYHSDLYCKFISEESEETTSTLREIKNGKAPSYDLNTSRVPTPM